MIAKNLKKFREEKGLTQQQVADELGINRSTYSYYELGRIQPDIKSIIKLSKIFDVHYIEILDEEDTTIFSDIALENSDLTFPKKIEPKIYNFSNLNLSDMEKKLILNFRLLPDDIQNNFFNIISKFVDKQSANPK